MTRQLLPLLFAMLAYSCKTRLEAVTPSINVQDIPAVKQRESSIHLPIRINLQPYFNEVEKTLPESFIGKEENCEGVSYSYKFIRNPIEFEGKGDVMYFEVDGKYSLNLNYCPECTAIFNRTGNCIVPRVYASCGVGEPMRRVSVGYSTNFTITPDLKFKTKTNLKKFETLDPCEITVFSYDATSTLRKEVTGVLKNLEKTIDKEIASIDIKSQLEEVWNLVAEPSNIGGYGFLNLQPKELSLSAIQFEKNAANVDLNLTVQPVFTLEKPLQKKTALPLLSNYKNIEGFDIELDAIANYDSLSSIINRAILNQYITIKNNKVIFKKLEVHGASNNKLQFKLEFDGKKSGVIYFIGTPKFNSENQTISFPDLTFDLESKNLLLKSAKWLFNDQITNKIRDQVVFDITPHMEMMKKNLKQQLNSELTKGVLLQGTAEIFRLKEIYAGKNSLLLRIQAKGTLKLCI
jgi:hypothetical protein